MQDCDSSVKEGYEELIRTGTVNTLVNFEASFYELKETNSLWGLFVNAGYLTIKEITDTLEGKFVLKIPNNEIKREFQSLTNNRQKSPISATISRWWDECSHFPLSFTQDKHD